jgi:hypothetical protein
VCVCVRREGGVVVEGLGKLRTGKSIEKGFPL